MRKIIISIGLAIVLILLNSALLLAQGRYPEPVGYVNDFANVIPADQEQQLEQMLADYEAKTTNEIAVVTVKSMDGQTVEDYTMGLAEQWKVGKEGKDNGVIILLALSERDIRIEVGYGLEPILTDRGAASIINKMVPLLKDGNYAAGIELGVKEVMGVVGFLTPEEIERQKKEQEERSRAAAAVFFKVLLGIVIVAVVIVLFVMLYRKISARQREQKRKVVLQQTNNERINQLSIWREQFFEPLKVSSQSDSEKLKAKTPPEVWEPVAEDIKQKETLFEAEFDRLRHLALMLNGKDRREFDAAAEAIKQMTNLKKSVELSLAQPAETLIAFEDARANVKTLESSAEEAIRQAERAGAGKNKLQEAREKVVKAGNIKESGSPNWLLVAGLLISAIALAQSVKSAADRKSAAYSMVREVKRAQRRKPEEKERNIYNRSSVSSNTWSSGSSISSHSSGFGGFGGGSFGGGGASGRF